MAKIIDEEKEFDKMFKKIRGIVDEMRDWAIENNAPDEDAEIEEKVAYEMMKSTKNYNELTNLYSKVDTKKLMTRCLLEEIYEIIKPANDKSDIVIKKLKNQLDGE